ncbi:MAG: hypothetical protein IPJ01_12210 [Micavibrio sp.]|nr:hypothetical protein [Micavibrio sp.]
MRTQKKNKPGERDFVNKLLRAVENNTVEPVFIFVDRDSGQERHTKSGFDFLILWRGQVVFVEAKSHKGVLSDYQKLTAAKIAAANGHCLAIHFDEKGETWRDKSSAFTPAVPTAETTAADFFR